MMSTSAILLAVLGATMALAVNWRSLQSHGLGGSQMVRMAAIWVAIIVALSLAVGLFLK